MPTIRVEFFGIPRQRAGTAAVELPLPSEGQHLAGLMEELARRFPGLKECIAPAGGPDASLACNLNGQRFVRRPDTVLAEGDTVLLMSADAGG